MENNKIILTNSTVTINNYIVTVKFNEGAKIEIADAEEITSASSKLIQNGNHGVLIDARYMMFISNEARKHFATRSNPLIKAVAMVVKSAFQKSFANMYLTFAKPIKPTQLFNDIEKATEWLSIKIQEKN